MKTTKKYFLKTSLIFFVAISIYACDFSPTLSYSNNIITDNTKEKPIEKILSAHTDTIIYTDGFDYPVGKPDGNGYYNAQSFGENNHLGDDWNGVGGGNTDLGDTIYSIANGYVNFAETIGGGWGNIIRITHYINDSTKVESLYAHSQKIFIIAGEFVKKGQAIGTIGTADGLYLAHLHFEIRDKINLPIGGGYDSNTNGYLDPTAFIKNNR